MAPKQQPPSNNEIRKIIGHAVKVDPRILGDPQQSLRQYGFATIKIFEREELAEIEYLIDTALREFPEYNYPLQDPKTGQPIPYSLGGFAAFGNPGSYHHPVLNLIRLHIYRALVKTFKATNIAGIKTGANRQLLVEMLLDRLAVREIGQSPPEEAWHRDVAPTRGTYLKRGDVVYGGFTNLNRDIDQFFSCVPGTHQGFTQFDLTAGFAEPDKKFHPFCKSHKYRVTIPPGYHVIFPQHIVHEIVAIPAQKRMYRIFFWHSNQNCTT